MTAPTQSRFRTPRHLVLAFGLLLIVAGAGAIGADLGIGVVNERPERPDFALSQYRLLHAYLREHLAAEGVSVGPLVVARDVPEMIAHLRAGEANLVIEGVISTLRMQQATAFLEPALLAWRKGQRQCHSVFFVRDDSPIQHLAELAGHSIAFESPRSTSAFYVPLITLIDQGLEVAPRGNVPQPGRVTYVFAGSELNQAYWVRRGKVDAAAFNDGDWRRTPRSVRSRLRIIAITPPVLRWLLSLHRDLPTSVREPLVDVLTGMHETDQGRQALHAAARIARFERLSPSDREGLTYWRELLARVPVPAP